MKLGAFSVSSNVKDIHKAKGLYEHVGFEIFGGDIIQNRFISTYIRQEHAHI